MPRLRPHFTIFALLLLTAGPAALPATTDRFGGGTAWSTKAACLLRVDGTPFGDFVKRLTETHHEFMRQFSNPS